VTVRAALQSWWSEPTAGRGRRLARGAFLGAAVAATSVRLYNATVYRVEWGHDGRSHDQYLGAILHLGRVHNRVEYGLLQGYLWTALHGWIFGVLAGADEHGLHQIGLAIGNVHLYLWMVAGLIVLARRLSLRGTAGVAFLALTTCAPVVQRSLDMLRPENLALAFVPWLLAGAFGIAEDLQQERAPSRLGRFALLLGVVFSAKIGGFTILFALGLGLLVCPGIVWRRRWTTVARTALLVALVAMPLFAAHRLYVGRWFFEHPTFTDRKIGRAYDHRAPASFYAPPDAAELWAHPVREAQRGSMSGILLADLEGDYWEYGPDHRRLAVPAGRHLRWQRLGLCGTALLLVLAVWGSVELGRRRSQMRNRFVLTHLGLLLGGGLAYIGLTCQIGFDPGTGNLIKWEYIGWVVPLLSLPVALGVEPDRPRPLRVAATLGALALCLLGLLRSPILLHRPW
jgi:hypothetical protein